MQSLPGTLVSTVDLEWRLYGPWPDAGQHSRLHKGWRGGAQSRARTCHAPTHPPTYPLAVALTCLPTPFLAEVIYAEEPPPPPQLVEDPTCAQLKAALLARCAALPLPPNFLDELIDELGGPQAVAEMTGGWG